MIDFEWQWFICNFHFICCCNSDERKCNFSATIIYAIILDRSQPCEWDDIVYVYLNEADLFLLLFLSSCFIYRLTQQIEANIREKCISKTSAITWVDLLCNYHLYKCMNCLIIWSPLCTFSLLFFSWINIWAIVRFNYVILAYFNIIS